MKEHKCEVCGHVQVSNRIITLTLNHLPYPELSPNARVHWRVKGLWARTAREEVGWLAKSEWHDDKPMVKAKISYDFHVKDNRHRDFDNLVAACKPFQDGLIDAGVLTYDDAKHLEMGIHTICTDSRCLASSYDHEETVITIQEL